MKLERFLGLEGTNRSDKGLLLLYLVSFVPLIYKLISPFFILSGLGGLTQFINVTLVLSGVYLAWKEIKRYINYSDILFYVIVAVFIIVSPLIYPNTQAFVGKNAFPFLTQVFPFFFAGLTLEYHKRRKILVLVAKAGIVVQIFWQICKLLGLVEVSSFDSSLGEQMEAAYGLLFPIFFLTIEMMTSFKMINFLFLIVGTLLMFFMGARGPIIVYVTFIAGLFLFFRKYKKYAAINRIAVILLFVGINYYLVPILRLFMYIASSLGFSTRVFDSVLGGEMVNIESSSDRDAIYDTIWNAVINDPSGFGYGWGGDRLLTQDKLWAHNFELEILCQYGIIGGGILLTMLFISLVRSYNLAKLNNTGSFWYVMLCSGLLSLQLSYTYISYPLFFIFLGYNITLLRKSYDYRLGYNNIAKMPHTSN